MHKKTYSKGPRTVELTEESTKFMIVFYICGVIVNYYSMSTLRQLNRRDIFEFLNTKK